MNASRSRMISWSVAAGAVSCLLLACGSTGSGAGSSEAGTSAGGSRGGSAGNAGSIALGGTSGGGSTSIGGTSGSGVTSMAGASTSGGTSGSSGSSGSGGAAGGGTPGSGGSVGGSGPLTGVPLVQSFDTNCLGVPDPDVAAGNDIFGMVGQWTAYFYNKKTGAADHQYTWKALQGSTISDTHIVFDIPSQRWFMTTILQNVTGAAYGVQVMVSTDASASSWKVSVVAHDTELIDNPQPTVSTDKVLLVFHGNCAWVVDKPDLYGGNAAVVDPTSCNLMSADNWVAVKYGGMPPSTAYAVTLADSSTLSWLAVDGTHATNDVKLQVHNITIPKVNAPPLWGNGGVTVNGNSIEAGEVKAMFQNGHIYWAKTTICNNSTCERLFDIDTVTNTATTHDFSFAGNQLWFGVPGVDKAGNVWMLASSSTTKGPIGLALMGVYSTGVSYDPNSIVTGTAQINNGSATTRWGDYYSAAQDPIDGSTWMIGQYGGGPAGLNPESNAGCKVVHVTPQ
jgi:hypothetical protein